jgi:hypothetical protein
MTSEMPLKELPRLVWELKRSDDLFCKNLIENMDKLWIHCFQDSAIVLKTDEVGPETLFVTSMKNIGISNLDRATKTLYLSEHITYDNLSFDKVNLGHLSEFKEHMNNQTQLISNFFEWSELNTVDTGIEEINAWSTLNGS